MAPAAPVERPPVWRWFGASVRGPAHVREGQPNQDAWLGCRRAFGTVVVVCDGLGSRPHSADGARQACRAVTDALRHWAAVEQAQPDLLLRLIHALWAIRVQPAGTDRSATTCLFAAALGRGPLLIAQLGDGLALLSTRTGEARPIGRPRTGFANQTTGLGIARAVSEWAVHVEPQPRPGTRVVLATDGVADDLVPDWPLVVRELDARFLGLRPRQRGAALGAFLRNWETPLHADDKTLAMLWSEPGGERTA